MSKARRPCEDEIFETVRAIPEEALPRVLKLVTLVREECRKGGKKTAESTGTSHERTRRLVASSKNNWAQDLVSERDDRL